MKGRLVLLSLLGFGLLAGSPARAGLTFFFSRSEFEAAFPEARSEDFEAARVAPGSQVAFDAPLTAETDNAVFAADEIRPGLVIQDTPGPSAGGLIATGAGFAGLPTKAVGTAAGSEGLDLRFPDDGVFEVALDVFAIDGGLVTATLIGRGGRLLASRSFTANPELAGFLGVASDDIPIVRIGLKALGTDLELVDNVTLVPEVTPGAGVLAGLAVCAARSRARRRALRASPSPRPLRSLR